MTARPSKAELALEVERLRGEGLTWPQVAEALGISESTAIKTRYYGRCEVCGELTDGGDGPGKARRVCKACFAEERRRRRHWTRERIIVSFQLFARDFGRAPAAGDVMGRYPSASRKYREARIAEALAVKDWKPGLPLPQYAQREFGSWQAAVRAAGLTPLRSGGASHRQPAHVRARAQTETLEVLGWAGPSTLRELAEIRGVTLSSQTTVVHDLGDRVVRSRRPADGRRGPMPFVISLPEERS